MANHNITGKSGEAMALAYLIRNGFVILHTKWLYYDRKDKDWMNKQQPCQFLDLNTNMCSIYAVRPADCAGFPHLTKRKMVNYMHVHKQNIAYCPATYRMVEKMKLLVATGKHLQ